MPILQYSGRRQNHHSNQYHGASSTRSSASGRTFNRGINRKYQRNHNESLTATNRQWIRNEVDKDVSQHSSFPQKSTNGCTESTARSVLLKGPKLSGPKRTTWRRSDRSPVDSSLEQARARERDGSSTNPSKIRDGSDARKSETLLEATCGIGSDESHKKANPYLDELRQGAQFSRRFEKVARNKLVLSDTSGEGEPSANFCREEDREDSTPTVTVGLKEAHNAEQSMKRDLNRFGSNKLVLQSGRESAQFSSFAGSKQPLGGLVQQVVDAAEMKTEEPKDVVPTSLKRAGPNKLVEAKEDTAASVRRRQVSNGWMPKAKRIKVSVTDVGHGSSGSEDGDKEGKVTEKLTDFAYRQTSSGVSKRRSTQQGARGRSRRNMGLVRVEPDESKTPICPAFLRGLPCNNPSCLKRHDVPKELSMPICSFFQRQGMCLKENCPFRHVKVNPRAVVCPSFSVLGFCDDPECTMMHSRPRPGTASR